MFVFSESYSHSQFQAITSIVSISIAVLFLEILYKRCGRQNKINLMKFTPLSLEPVSILPHIAKWTLLGELTVVGFEDRGRGP